MVTRNAETGKFESNNDVDCLAITANYKEVEVADKEGEITTMSP